MLADVTVDGLAEDEFRHSIEAMLREETPELALRRLRKLLGRLCGDNAPLPARFLKVSCSDVTVSGWSDLHTAMDAIDAEGEDVTAISFDLSLPHAEAWWADDEGNPMAEPRIEARYYTDEAFAFSTASHADLVAAYDAEGAPWHGRHYPDGDGDALQITGLADLNGPLVDLGESITAGKVKDEDSLVAHVLGSCLIAVLIHQAVREAALRGGLPRTMAILAGRGDAFPHFDAPVIAARSDIPAGDDFLLSLQFTDAPDPESVCEAEPDLVPAEENSGMDSLLELHELAEPEPDPGDDPEAWHLPPPGIHVTGTQLRRRFVTAENIAETQDAPRPSLFQRLFARAQGA